MSMPLHSMLNPSTPTPETEEDSHCFICHEPYNNGTAPEIPITLPCGHIFGSICIHKWLHVPRRTNGCPLCRSTLFTVPATNQTPDEAEDDRHVSHPLPIPDTYQTLIRTLEGIPIFGTIRHSAPTSPDPESLIQWDLRRRYGRLASSENTQLFHLNIPRMLHELSYAILLARGGVGETAPSSSMPYITLMAEAYTQLEGIIAAEIALCPHDAETHAALSAFARSVRQHRICHNIATREKLQAQLAAGIKAAVLASTEIELDFPSRVRIGELLCKEDCARWVRQGRDPLERFLARFVRVVVPGLWEAMAICWERMREGDAEGVGVWDVGALWEGVVRREKEMGVIAAGVGVGGGERNGDGAGSAVHVGTVGLGLARRRFGGAI